MIVILHKYWYNLVVLLVEVQLMGVVGVVSVEHVANQGVVNVGVIHVECDMIDGVGSVLCW